MIIEVKLIAGDTLHTYFKIIEEIREVGKVPIRPFGISGCDLTEEQANYFKLKYPGRIQEPKK